MGRNIVLTRAKKAFKLEEEEQLKKMSQMQIDLDEGQLEEQLIPTVFVEPVVSDQAAKFAFMETIRKIEQVRHVSSPILKVVFIQRVIDELMGVDPESGECAEADKLIFLIFYVIVSLRSSDNPQLGARLIEECYYID